MRVRRTMPTPYAGGLEPGTRRPLCQSGSVRVRHHLRPRPARRSPARSLPAVLALVLLPLAACTPGSSPGAASSASPVAPTGSAAPEGCSYPAAGQAAKPVKPPPTSDVPTTGTVRYTLAMTGGDVTITMDRSKTPCTVNSFVSLAEQGYFNGTRCH